MIDINVEEMKEFLMKHINNNTSIDYIKDSHEAMINKTISRESQMKLLSVVIKYINGEFNK